MRVYLVLSSLLLMFSCKKDNPEPIIIDNGGVPVPVVDLNCHFFGTVNGTDIELTPNVLGFYGYTALNSDYINMTTVESVYSFKMQSDQTPTAIEVRHGGLFWDSGNGNTSPTLSTFNSFHFSDTLPSYTIDALSGFEAVFTDFNGGTWVSSPTSPNPQSVEFTFISNESDNSGDYSKFSCEFSCYLYNTGQTDSILIENATLTGWFKR